MRRRMQLALLAFLVSILPGCGDRIDLEDVSFMLAVGLDLDDQNNLLIYSTIPVFSKNAKDKVEELGVKVFTIRQAQGKFDGLSNGLFLGWKVQVMLLGKRLLQHPDWVPLLDTFFRDPKISVTPRIAVVDGPVSEVINFHPEDKPPLFISLRDMIDTSSQRGYTQRTMLQELDRQMFEKGITPAISQVKLEKELEIHGVALLDKKGKYVASLRNQEAVLLRMLQEGVGDFSLTLPIYVGDRSGTINRNRLSFDAHNVNTKVKTAYRGGKFKFDIHVDMYMVLTERYFPYDMRKNKEKMEHMVEKEIANQFSHLVKKIQKYDIDPIGLGLYARAFEYKPYKQVEDDWGKALGKADIKVSVDVKLKSMGAIK